MAYVAISERFRDDVRNTIRLKQNAELNLLVKPQTPTLHVNDPRIIERFWGDYTHLRGQIPAGWCSKVDSLSLITEFEKIPGDVQSLDRADVGVTITGGQILVPPKTDTYYPKLSVPPDAPEVVDHVRYIREQYEVNLKWNKVATDVMNFLTNCKSLNEALKLWPDIKIYIPQHYIDKAEEKTVKAKAAESKAMEILKQIDTDHAISSAVLVRILEANKTQENHA